MAYGNITLTSGMRQNLVSLQKTNSLMETTQKRLASGKKVNTALDDPVKYFAALGHTNRANDLATRKSEMGEAIQTIKAGNTGIEAITDLIESAKSTAQSALAIDSTGTSNLAQRASLATQFGTLRTQLDELAKDSGYKGTNFLQDGTLVVDFHETSGDSTLTITGFDGDTSGLSIDSASGAWTNDALVTAAISDLDSAKSELRTQAQSLSNALSTITIRQDFTQNMINTLEDGASMLVNADMNEEGANMLMLQTRQALGTTSLSLASQAAQSVLRLF